MTKKTIISIYAVLVCCAPIFGQTTFKAMFYNVLNYPDQGPANRIDNLDVILLDFQPDIFMACEINTIQGSNDILNALQNVKSEFSAANFVTNTSDDMSGNQNDFQNMLYYDSSKFILEAQTEITTIFRDFNHYTLKLNTVDQATNPIILNVIVCHLKSSSGVDNQNLRLQMVNDLVAYMESWPSDELVLLGGDLNLYTSSESAFQELLDSSNNITFTDPANRIGSWHNNSSFIDVFTQSTRTQSGMGGATGGFDDRFDFILTSQNMLTSPDLYYVDTSYKVYGNNGTVSCYNQEINSTNCAGTDYDQTIRDALYFMSDHLPVTVELQTNEVLLSIEEFQTTTALNFLGSNLVDDHVIFQMQPTQINFKSIKIFNALGQEIGTYTIEHLNQLKINVSNWSKGLYYVVTSNNAIKPLKFIKK
ncbi:MAG: T9SS type A sorting domain-containing protein [Flavobacteriaceae bacterium]|nr:T9SS type A sorting domain-containing protein [Flavobacteriaceae bacterium]